MNRSQKDQEIAFLSDQLSLAKAVFVICFKGMNVAQVTSLRKKLHPLNAKMKVVRNTLARLASEKLPEKISQDFKQQFKNDNALVFAHGEVGPLAKLLKNLSEDIQFLEFKAGVLENKLLDHSKILYLANLPNKPELQAKLLGVLQAPASKFVRQLVSPMSQILQVMTEYNKKAKN